MGKEESTSFSALLFRCGHKWGALPTESVDEVISLRPIHCIPFQQQSYIKRVVGYRGGLLTCVSLHEWLDVTFEPETYVSLSRILVIHTEENSFAAKVDEVDTIVDLSVSSLTPINTELLKPVYTIGESIFGDRCVTLLDPHLLSSSVRRLS